LPGIWFIKNNFSGDISIAKDNVKVSVLNHETGKIMKLGLEEYVVGVVAAEMPASFPLEALKAQAVAARTYAVKRLQLPDPRVRQKNKEADLITDPAINQAWISTTEMEKRWGKWNYGRNKNKILKAVAATQGEVVVYRGQLIDPVYHASCGGSHTENSEEVWKFSIPYLKGVPCTGHTDRHNSKVTFVNFNEFSSKLGINSSSIQVSKTMTQGKILKTGEKTKTGRVKNVWVNGKQMSGVELRSKLGLPSTRFNWQVTNNGVEFISNGYGHGIGMCQYGAADLAEQGKAYNQILYHYFTGVKVVHIKKG
jgi:stage II sporulation protein D